MAQYSYSDKPVAQRQRMTTEFKRLKAAQQYDAAEALLAEALNRYPNDVVFLHLGGNYCLHKGAVDEAIGFFEDILTIEPNNIFALNGMVKAYDAKVDPHKTAYYSNYSKLAKDQRRDATVPKVGNGRHIQPAS
jgi:tetratricopeptide (TPR) repeat protein